MRSTPAGRTAAALATLVIGVALAACGGRGSARAESGRARATDLDAVRIARVERGLLPTVALRGRRDTAYTLADRMQRYGVPGVSIAVIDGGRVAWARAYGTLEAGGARIDTATLFQAGSISKAITAVAALHLVDRGVLRLDEDVNLRLVSWRIPASELTRTRPVTLRGLLSHGAGLNVPSFTPGYVPGAAAPTLLQVLEGTPPASNPPIRVEVAPGTEWRYSGGGLSVVQQLIVDVTGRPFADVLHEAVFDRAGMTRTLAEQPLSAEHATSAATAHSAGAPIAGRWRVHPELAAAGLWSTAPDLARFGVALLRTIRGERGALLLPATARDMVTRQIGDWGLGFALGGGGGDSATVGHDGSTAGFTARLLVLPATGQGIAVMTNAESEALIDEIMRAVAREYAWPVRPRVVKSVATVDAAGYATLAGRYRVEVGERTFDFDVRVEGTGDGRRLIITGPSGRPGVMLPLSSLHFFSQDTGNEFTFTREGNVVTSMLLDQQGERYTARRLP